jgi:FkbM family methyltransferase
MKSSISELATTILRILPTWVHAVLLRKAVAISSERVKFLNGQTTMLGSIENLREVGFSPLGIVDVGANVGSWTRDVAKIFPDALIHMVEAQPELMNDLAATAHQLGRRVTYSICLLGAKCIAQVPFHTIGTGSSVFEEVTNLEKKVRLLPMKRLDDIAAVRAMNAPLLLKLDVQGYELEVLRGASETLKLTEAVLMEVSLLPYNKGAPLMPEVISFMHDLGFTPYDFCGELRRVSDHALFQVDMIFVRKGSTLREYRRFSMFEPVDYSVRA